MKPRELPDKWRTEADAYERDGVGGHSLLRRVADELANALAESELEALTLREGEAHSGYSYSHLQRLVSGGVLENVGEPGDPRVRRGDLPHKAGRLTDRLKEGRGDLADEILARRES